MAPESHPLDEDARLESDLDAQLRALPRREIDPRVDARVLRSARAILVEGPRRGPLHFLEVIWGRVVAPVLVTATVASYLLWAVQAAGALYR